eukprot:4549401-Amphidinium_carterae.1
MSRDCCTQPASRTSSPTFSFRKAPHERLRYCVLKAAISAIYTPLAQSVSQTASRKYALGNKGHCGNYTEGSMH